MQKILILNYLWNTKCVEFVDEKLHQIVASDGSKANATIITASLGDGNFNLSSLDDGIDLATSTKMDFIHPEMFWIGVCHLCFYLVWVMYLSC